MMMVDGTQMCEVMALVPYEFEGNEYALVLGRDLAHGVQEPYVIAHASYRNASYEALRAVKVFDGKHTHEHRAEALQCFVRSAYILHGSSELVARLLAGQE